MLAMGRLATGLAAILLVTACSQTSTAGADSASALPPLDNDIEKPQLALADHVLGNYSASDLSMRPTVCIATTDGREEVALEQGMELELMTRYPGLAPFSRCALLDSSWQDTDTGDAAMVFSLHTFTCTMANSCSGFSHYMFGKETSPASRYQLDWGGKRWVFTRDEPLAGEQ